MSISHFTAVVWLGFLAVVALLVLGYVLVQRARHKRMLQFGNMAILERVAPSRPSPMRHAPIALILVGLVLLTIAAAGPTAVQKVPRNRATVVLVMDVSLSMEATDVPPNRLQVAQKAGKDFVDGLTPGINLGFVTFAGTASVMVSPTTNREAVKHSIDNIQAGPSAPPPARASSPRCSRSTPSPPMLGGARRAPPARVVLMSDGKQTVPDDKDVDNPRHGFTAARLAKNKGIPVSTISFGTEWGTVEIPDSDGKGSQRVKVPVDNDSLREIAELSGGDFYTASSLAELTAVYDTLEEQIGYETTRGDASRPWLLFGMLAIAAGVVVSLLYRQRLP